MEQWEEATHREKAQDQEDQEGTYKKEKKMGDMKEQGAIKSGKSNRAWVVSNSKRVVTNQAWVGTNSLWVDKKTEVKRKRKFRIERDSKSSSREVWRRIT